MKPKLQFLLTCRDVIIDIYVRDLTPLRTFDTVYIEKNQQSVIYSFNVVGRIFLMREGRSKVSMEIKITDPDGQLLRTERVDADNILGTAGANINAKFSYLEFVKEGEYLISANVSVNEEQPIDLDLKSFFYVKRTN